MSENENKNTVTASQYTTPISMLIIGLLLNGAGAIFSGTPILQLLMGLIGVVLILSAAGLAVRRMQRDPDLNP